MNTHPRRDRGSDQRPRLRLVAAVAESGTSAASEDDAPGCGIEVSAEVTQALGAATVMRLRADPDLREYVCTICDEPGRIHRPDDPASNEVPGHETGPSGGAASLVILRYPNGVAAVHLAHAECSPSAVLRLLREPRLDHRVDATCWLRPATTPPDGTGTHMAVLLIDNQVRAWPRTQAQDPGDDYTRAVEATGFSPVHDLDQPPPPLPGLTITITTGGHDDDRHNEGDGLVTGSLACGWARVTVTHPDGVAFDGVVSAPRVWVEQARWDGAVTVVTGTALTPTRLPDVPGGQVTPQVLEQARQFIDSVAAAVAAGRAWAAVATLATAPEESQSHPNQGTGEAAPGQVRETKNETSYRIPRHRRSAIHATPRHAGRGIQTSSEAINVTRRNCWTATSSPGERAG